MDNLEEKKIIFDDKHWFCQTQPLWLGVLIRHVFHSVNSCSSVHGGFESPSRMVYRSFRGGKPPCRSKMQDAGAVKSLTIHAEMIAIERQY